MQPGKQQDVDNSKTSYFHYRTGSKNKEPGSSFCTSLASCDKYVWQLLSSAKVYGKDNIDNEMRIILFCPGKYELIL